MSELTDYIDQHGVTVVAAQLRESPDFRILNMMWKSPADLILLANEMRWQTLADVQAWVTASLALPKADVFFKQVLAPSSQVHQPFFVSEWAPIDTAIAQQCNRAADFKRVNEDDTYRVPTLAQLQVMAQECWSHRFAGGGQDFDCDDYTRIARGWLSANELGNIAAGQCVFRMYAGSEFLASHALLLALTKESSTSSLVCHWWEPQTGQTYPISFTQFAGRADCNRIELFFCDF